MKVPFLGQAYQSRSAVLASQTAINIFPELTEGNEQDEVGAFYGTPGLITKYTGTGEVRGLHVAGIYLFAVIGQTVWRLTSDFTATNLGNLPNSTGRVSMTSNESQVAIAHRDGWHWVSFTGSAIARVSGSPNDSILAEQDQYVLFTGSGIGGQFGITSLADLSTIDPLDVADAEGDPDNLVSLVSSHREAALLGENSIEIWSNTGAPLFPFERNPGGFIEMGCAAKFSPSKLDGSVFWLGKDRNGKGIVFRSNSYSPERISTHAIEYAINKYSRIDDAIGYSYQEEGHSFYVLTFPTGDATWVYDIATKGWHQRAWLDANGQLRRHRGNCFTNFNGMNLVGDWQNGNIYQMSLDAYTDAGDEIYRERAFDLPEYENKRVRLDKFQMLATIGDGASPTDGSKIKLWLQVSRDAGRNFGYQRIINTGAIGKTQARAMWRRIGTARNPVLRVATTMANRVHWVAGFLDGEELDQ